MSGNYISYYVPMIGHVLVLPFPEEKISSTIDYVAPKLGAEGNIIDLQGGDINAVAGIQSLIKGIVVEKGKQHPRELDEIKRKDVVLIPRDAGLPITLKTQSAEGGPVEREFRLVKTRDIVAVL